MPASASLVKPSAYLALQEFDRLQTVRGAAALAPLRNNGIVANTYAAASRDHISYRHCQLAGLVLQWLQQYGEPTFILSRSSLVVAVPVGTDVSADSVISISYYRAQYGRSEGYGTL